MGVFVRAVGARIVRAWFTEKANKIHVRFMFTSISEILQSSRVVERIFLVCTTNFRTAVGRSMTDNHGTTHGL